MLGKPKYNLGDTVHFIFNDTDIIGTIYIIDKFGTFKDNSDVSYDIMVTEKDNTKCLYKHIPEKNLFLTK